MDSSVSAREAGAHGAGRVQQLEESRYTGSSGLPGQLSRLQNSEMQATLTQRVTGLADRFAELADTLLPVELRTNEMGEGFGKAVSRFEEKARAAFDRPDLKSASGTAAMNGELRAAFGSLRVSALGLFAPDIAGQLHEDAATFPKEIPSPLAQFMTELASTFSNAMSELTEVLSNDQDLPRGELPSKVVGHDPVGPVLSRTPTVRPEFVDMQA